MSKRGLTDGRLSALPGTAEHDRRKSLCQQPQARLNVAGNHIADSFREPLNQSQGLKCRIAVSRLSIPLSARGHDVAGHAQFSAQCPDEVRGDRARLRAPGDGLATFQLAGSDGFHGRILRNPSVGCPDIPPVPDFIGRPARISCIPCMIKSSVIENVLELSASDRLEVMEEIWDSLDEEKVGSGLTDAMRAELDRRLADHEANPSDAVSWGHVK